MKMTRESAERAVMRMARSRRWVLASPSGCFRRRYPTVTGHIAHVRTSRHGVTKEVVHVQSVSVAPRLDQFPQAYHVSLAVKRIPLGKGSLGRWMAEKIMVIYRAVERLHRVQTSALY